MIESSHSTIDQFRAFKAARVEIGREHEALIRAAEQTLAAFKAVWETPE